MSLVGQTSAPQLLLAAFRVLSPEEQDEAFELIQDDRLVRLAGTESEMERMLTSLRLVAAECDGDLTVTQYRDITRASNDPRLIGATTLIRFFGSWRRAREALDLSETTTARRIDARFRNRRLDKVWRYTEATLRETIQSCVDDLGFIPQVAEFDHWRARELELAKAQGNDAFHLPSATPYRRRWGTWEDALLRLGFTLDAVKERLERQ